MADAQPNRAARRCRTKRERTIVVEGFDPPLKLHIRTTFGELMQLQADMAASENGDTQAQVNIMLGFFDRALNKWEGVFGEDDAPLPYSQAAFRDLDIEDATAIMEAVQTIGDQGSGDPLAATASAEDSGGPPAP